MKQITRQEAEALFQTAEVISTDIKQNNRELCICSSLSDKRSFFVKYDLLDHVKRYYLQDVII